MKVHNVRLGFATNSSSSHSIIFDPHTKALDEDVDDFGWSFFTAASKEAKSQYVAATLRQNLDREMHPALIDVICRGLGLPTDCISAENSNVIDHQSLYTLPKAFGTDHFSSEFFEEFRDYLLRDGVVILGGNDNDSETHPLADETKRVTFGKWQPESDSMVCRKDGDWWTLYSKQSGNRVVFSFLDNPAPFVPVTPMLLDMKITDYCDHGCAYCYQGSTKDGQHMDSRLNYHYAKMLQEASVFEIAVGGGEPTQCPSFVDFVEFVSDIGVVVNFTTKSTDWLEDTSKADEIIGMIGAFAYSADSASIRNLDRIYSIFKYRKYDLRKFTVQIVPATMGEYHLKSLLTWCKEHDVRATLLGYKETGRGAKFKEIAIRKTSWNKFDESKWLTVVESLHQENKLCSLSIDTTMAAKFLDQLQTTGIPDWMYHVEEGKYSMYIDMVASTYGPSSYHPDKLVKFGTYQADLAEMFAKVEPV